MVGLTRDIAVPPVFFFLHFAGCTRFCDCALDLFPFNCCEMKTYIFQPVIYILAGQTPNCFKPFDVCESYIHSAVSTRIEKLQTRVPVVQFSAGCSTPRRPSRLDFISVVDGLDLQELRWNLNR